MTSKPPGAWLRRIEGLVSRGRQKPPPPLPPPVAPPPPLASATTPTAAAAAAETEEAAPTTPDVDAVPETAVQAHNFVAKRLSFLKNKAPPRSFTMDGDAERLLLESWEKLPGSWAVFSNTQSTTSADGAVDVARRSKAAYHERRRTDSYERLRPPYLGVFTKTLPLVPTPQSPHVGQLLLPEVARNQIGLLLQLDFPRSFFLRLQQFEKEHFKEPFHDKTLLIRAFIHRDSLPNAFFWTHTFLALYGDNLLDFAIMGHVSQTQPSLTLENMVFRQHRLRSNFLLSKIGHTWKVDKLIVKPASVEMPENSKIYADCVEAVIGAMLLDRGLDVTLQWTRQTIVPLLLALEKIEDANQRTIAEQSISASSQQQSMDELPTNTVQALSPTELTQTHVSALPKPTNVLQTEHLAATLATPSSLEIPPRTLSQTEQAAPQNTSKNVELPSQMAVAKLAAEKSASTKPSPPATTKLVSINQPVTTGKLLTDMSVTAKAPSTEYGTLPRALASRSPSKASLPSHALVPPRKLGVLVVPRVSDSIKGSTLSVLQRSAQRPLHPPIATGTLQSPASPKPLAELLQPLSSSVMTPPAISNRAQPTPNLRLAPDTGKEIVAKLPISSKTAKKTPAKPHNTLRISPSAVIPTRITNAKPLIDQSSDSVPSTASSPRTPTVLSTSASLAARMSRSAPPSVKAAALTRATATVSPRLSPQPQQQPPSLSPSPTPPTTQPSPSPAQPSRPLSTPQSPRPSPSLPTPQPASIPSKSPAPPAPEQSPTVQPSRSSPPPPPLPPPPALPASQPVLTPPTSTPQSPQPSQKPQSLQPSQKPQSSQPSQKPQSPRSSPTLLTPKSASPQPPTPQPTSIPTPAPTSQPLRPLRKQLLPRPSPTPQPTSTPSTPQLSPTPSTPQPSPPTLAPQPPQPLQKQQSPRPSPTPQPTSTPSTPQPSPTLSTPQPSPPTPPSQPPRPSQKPSQPPQSSQKPQPLQPSQKSQSLRPSPTLPSPQPVLMPSTPRSSPSVPTPPTPLPSPTPSPTPQPPRPLQKQQSPRPSKPAPTPSTPPPSSTPSTPQPSSTPQTPPPSPTPQSSSPTPTPVPTLQPSRPSPKQQSPRPSPTPSTPKLPPTPSTPKPSPASPTTRPSIAQQPLKKPTPSPTLQSPRSRSPTLPRQQSAQPSPTPTPQPSPTPTPQRPPPSATGLEKPTT